MSEPSVPASEARRLAALRRYQILDTPPEEAFDRITRLASHSLEVPIALITLLDDERQWFKSCVGLDTRETSREVAFCAYNIHDEDVMVVEDATRDERFADNPLVTGDPAIRFYAGAPLITPGGHILGSVCAIDTEPRSISETETERLRDLAAMAVDELELRATRRHRTDILESITDAFVAVGDDWTFTYVNEQAVELLGRAREALIGTTIWDVFPDAAELDVQDRFRRVVRERDPAEFEAHFPELDRWFEVSAHPFENGLSVYFHDITERKEREQKNARLAAIVKSSQHAIVGGTREGIIHTWNEAAVELYGYDKDEAIGKPISMLVPPERKREFREEIMARLREGESIGPLETVRKRKDGDRFTALLSVSPIKTPDGAVEGVAGSLIDITERKERAKALRRQRDLLQNIFDASPAAIVTLDDEGQFLTASKRAQEVLGLEPPDVQERAFNDPEWRITDADGNPIPDEELPFARVMETGAPVHNFEHAIEWPDGERRLLSISGAPLRDGEGNLSGAVFVMDDITEERQAQNELLHSRERLARAQELVRLGSWERNLRSGELFWSDVTREIFGIGPNEDVPFDAFMEQVHPADQETLRHQQRRALAGEGEIDLEYRIRRPDGEERIVHERGAAEFNGAGEPIRIMGTVLDVTEWRKADEQMRLLEAAVENAADSILITEATFDEPGPEIVYVNESFEEATGYNRNEVIGQTPRILQGPGTRREPLDRMREAFERSKPVRETVLNYTKDGEPFWNELYIAPVTGDDGWVTHLVSIQRDVTEERMMRRTLAENKERFQALAEETSDVISRVDERGTFLYLSPAIESLLGYRPEALIGRPFHPYIHPEDRPTIQSRLQAAFEGERVQVEHRLQHAAGHYIWVESTARVTGRNRDTATVVVSTRPIGRRKRAEQELQRERNLLQNIFAASPAAILVFDPQGTITFANERAEAVLGQPIDAIIGTSFNDPGWGIETEHGEIPPDAELPFARVIEREAPIEGAEHTITTAEGERRLLSTNGAPLRDENGELLGAVFVVEDITKRRQRKTELVEAKETAEAAREVAEEMNELKSALLANMSHEIRTPLTSIIGFSEVLGGMELEPPAGRFIQMIQRGGDRLLTTLNSVLDLSQLEAGAMHLHPEDVAVGSLVRDIAAGFQLRAQEADVELTVDTPDSGTTAHLDAGALERIASNLISNAIKFTGEGSAPGGRVAVRLDAPGDRLILTVADTGVGIDEAFVPHLFDAFKQESTGDARDFEGSGLGLTITGELVDLMGGAIDVESQKGEGTTFTVTLPRDA